MPSLYAQYIKERENIDILETEQGFATYSISGEICYIRDIFVHKDHRKSSIASELADKIVEIARQNYCTELLGTVDPLALGATASMKVLLAYGFNVKCLNGALIIFTKKIEG